MWFSMQSVRGQEPGTESEIKEFCSTKFGVSFPNVFKKLMLTDPIDTQFMKI